MKGLDSMLTLDTDETKMSQDKHGMAWSYDGWMFWGADTPRCFLRSQEASRMYSNIRSKRPAT